ncbi:hypothetical protein [Microbacterium sp.]|uniref:hypothetical protein n=1 Tax=Microbacterium sp. TaxID=51671 RepID=UPI003A8FC70B
MSENLADDFAALLHVKGWSIVREHPGGSPLWSFQDRAEMYLPPVVRRGSFLWTDLTERIADAHEEKVASVERAIDLVRFDVTRFRVDSAPGSRAIPLEAGAAVVGSAFGMLRAAATSARRPRQSIGSNYSKLGDAIAREARLAHTEEGSFVFPVMLKVSPPDEPEQPALEQEGFDWVRPESPERRVTRTLAQALTAFEKHVLEPARDPRMSDLTPVIIAGGTKEMFAQVSGTLAEPGVSWLEAGFTWAPIESAAAESPSRVMISADTEVRELVSRSVRLLSTPKSDPLRVITGPIITISHAPGEPIGEIAIQTPSPTSARFGRVEVTVREAQLSEIHHWMDQGTTVVVHGTVERRPGRPARLKEIATPRPLEDTLSITD